MWNILVYLTFHENAVRLSLLCVNVLFIYLASKQVVHCCFCCVSIAWHFSNIMVTTHACHSANQVMAQQYNDAVNKTPVAKKKCSNQAPPDTDATLPVPTHMLAIQVEELRAQLSVFPHGHRGPSGARLLAEMNQELLNRDTK